MMKFGALLLFLRRTVQQFVDDNCIHLAAAISFYVLLGLFPLALALVSILGFVLGSRTLEAEIIEGLGELLPSGRGFVTTTLRGIIVARGATGLVASFGLLISGMSVFSAIRKALNLAWGIRRPRPFFKEKLLELAMMAGAGLLFGLSLSLTAALRLLREASRQWVAGLGLDGAVLWNSLTVAAPAALSFLTFLFLYRLIPNTRVRWGDVWLGAAVAAFGFEAVKNGFAWYVQNLGHHSLVYGSVGAVIALVTWAYLSANVLLFGAEVAGQYARARAPHPSPLTVAPRPTQPRRRLPVTGILLGLAILAAISLDTLRRVQGGRR